MKQAANHFEYHHEISKKDTIFFNLSDYCASKSLNVFDYTPLSFFLNLNSVNFERDFERFLAIFNHYEKNRENPSIFKMSDIDLNFKSRRKTYHTDKNKSKYNRQKFKNYPSYFEKKNLWLIKPTSYNRGRGIRIFDSISLLH